MMMLRSRSWQRPGWACTRWGAHGAMDNQRVCHAFVSLRALDSDVMAHMSQSVLQVDI